MVRVKQSSSDASCGITNGSSGTFALAERAGLAASVLVESENVFASTRARSLGLAGLEIGEFAISR